MKKTYFILLICLTIFTNCTSKTDAIDNNEKIESPEELGELPELSVYHLPTHWTNQNNEEIKLEDFRGKTVVAVMIYTTCRASCPKLIQDMKNIHDKVSKSTNQNTKYVFVSIDPEIDTPKRLKDFSEEREMTADEWEFLRGTEEDTQEFAAVLGVSYKKTTPIDYAHSNIITVFDHNGVVTYQKDGIEGNYDKIVAEIEKLAR